MCANIGTEVSPQLKGKWRGELERTAARAFAVMYFVPAKVVTQIILNIQEYILVNSEFLKYLFLKIFFF